MTQHASKAFRGALLSSPLGRIRLGICDGGISSLDFEEGTVASQDAQHFKPSHGTINGLQIRTFRLAQDEEQELLPMHEADSDNSCKLIEDSLSGDVSGADLALMRKAASELDQYFHGNLRVFSVPLQLHGSEFQRRIWQSLIEIPFGSSLSYGELAQKAGYSSASYGRAAGTAVGSNPVSIIVPCHRIVSKDGKMTGYSGGLWRKLRLLSLEGFSIAA